MGYSIDGQRTSAGVPPMLKIQQEPWSRNCQGISVLGIDPGMTFPDYAGRPTPILDEGQAIAEVI
jgi:hypothetical protein